MSIEALITIVGGFGVMALSINAFFLKGIYSELNDVRIQMAVIISNTDFLKQDIQRVEKEIHLEMMSIKKKQHDLSNSLMRQELEIERLKK